jgi:hypothetical protein
MRRDRTRFLGHTEDQQQRAEPGCPTLERPVSSLRQKLSQSWAYLPPAISICAAHSSRQMLTLDPKTCYVFTLFTTSKEAVRAQGGPLDKKAEERVKGLSVLIPRCTLDRYGEHAEDATGSSGGGVRGKKEMTNFAYSTVVATSCWACSRRRYSERACWHMRVANCSKGSKVL